MFVYRLSWRLPPLFASSAMMHGDSPSWDAYMHAQPSSYHTTIYWHVGVNARVNPVFTCESGPETHLNFMFIVIQAVGNVFFSFFTAGTVSLWIVQLH
jgi:hypothetical protein